MRFQEGKEDKEKKKNLEVPVKDVAVSAAAGGVQIVLEEGQLCESGAATTTTRRRRRRRENPKK